MNLKFQFAEKANVITDVVNSFVRVSVGRFLLQGFLLEIRLELFHIMQWWCVDVQMGQGQGQGQGHKTEKTMPANCKV